MTEVTYSIKEWQQCLLDKINLSGVAEEVKPKILEKLVNKQGKPLNVIELESDLSRALDQLREEGYFYATITNLDKNSVVTYESNYTKSQLNLNFKPGKIALFETAVLAGNRVTKDKVLLREIKIEKGDFVTPGKIKNIRDRINSLGIFGRVQVIPLVVNKLTNDDFNKTNLIIQVQEKKFGRGEIAPGYRTDVGAKISLTLTKSNVLGLNDSGTLKFQVNRRFSLRQFDARRRASRKHRIEGISRFSYSFPHLFDVADFTSNVSIQRRRFFAFDADIYRISPQLTKQIVDKPGNRIGASLKYQYERIRQFDATQLRDRATFEIGSITPGLTFDFRDSQISPRSGAYFGLSWEFANPGFGSQKDSEIEINFSKVISRNRFYIPLYSKTFVLAISLAAGMQRNYATNLVSDGQGGLQTKGYIPSIKVFRLDGFDLVRGFADAEINRLRNGNDITEERIDGRAYFTNLKFEPRYYMSDSIVLGTFFDAGKIHLNKFKPLDVRTSAGLTFKFLTPVGTLDFDYGVKLRRIRSGLDERESFGRFHLSIGYF
jgi:outer membrane protein insertion porin family